MGIRGRYRGSARAGLLSSLIALFALTADVRSAGPNETTKLDCGINALFVLLRLERRPVTLDHLETKLPPHHPEGYSMAELSAASGALGLTVEGVRFANGDKAPTRPAIAFLKDAQGGHFAVLRPVGTTGTMVQVIDPPHPPWITDYDRLLKARYWTGRILLPRDPWPVHVAIPLFLAALFVPLVSFAIWQQRRSSRRSTSDVLVAS